MGGASTCLGWGREEGEGWRRRKGEWLGASGPGPGGNEGSAGLGKQGVGRAVGPTGGRPWPRVRPPPERCPRGELPREQSICPEREAGGGSGLGEGGREESGLDEVIWGREEGFGPRMGSPGEGSAPGIWARVRGRRVGASAPGQMASDPGVGAGGAHGRGSRHGRPLARVRDPGWSPSQDAPQPGWGRGGPQRVGTPGRGSSPPYLSAAASPAALPKHRPEPAQVGADGGRDLQRRVEAGAHPEQGRPGGGRGR